MRGIVRLLAASLTLLLFVPLVALAAAPVGDSNYHIALPRRAVAAGERIVLKLVPPPPPGASVAWIVRLTAIEGMGLPGGVYFAPYSIPAGAPPAKVSVRIRDGSIVSFARAEIELMPGSVPGAEDCLGPGQTFSIAAAALTPPIPLFSTWPNLIQSVQPLYPRSAFVRGIRDTIHVLALVCRTGHVLDAHEAVSYRDTGTGNPFDPDPASLIEHDPRLVDAAIVAVRQYVFSPAFVDGYPAAFQSLTAVIFDPTVDLRAVDPDLARLPASISPNPLNPRATLTFAVARPGRVTVRLYDVAGHLARTVISEQQMLAGTYHATIDGRDGQGRELASGVYFYRIEAPDGITTGRFAVMK